MLMVLMMTLIIISSSITSLPQTVWTSSLDQVVGYTSRVISRKIPENVFLNPDILLIMVDAIITGDNLQASTEFVDKRGTAMR